MRNYYSIETKGEVPLAAAHGSADFDDYPEQYWDEEETCEMCGGDGVIEYLDHAEVWGEDCPSDQNHLLPCPECRRRELAERSKANPSRSSMEEPSLYKGQVAGSTPAATTISPNDQAER